MRSQIRSVVLAAAGVVLTTTGVHAAVIQQSITIDGSMLDWAPVLANQQNYVADLSVEQGDPDAPGSSDRDLRAFAYTWDATNLYLFFRRTFGANNSVTFLAYIDLYHDNVLTTSDRIVRYDFNGSSPSTRELRRYVPAGTADPITGDGVSEPGSMGTTLAATMDSAALASGIDVECSIAWTSLGVPAGTPLRFHAADAVGTNLPGQIRDNTDPIDSQFAIATLTADRFQATGVPATVQLAHTLTNNGNGSDRFDLSTGSLRNWTASLWSDPDGDGDPSDGQLLAVDQNGDGDYADPLDTPPAPVNDGNSNGLPDTGLIAAGAIRSYVVELQVPSGTANGIEDTVTVLARSALDAAVVGRNQDTVVVADVTTIAPAREKGAPPGFAADAAHQVCNLGTLGDVVDITTSSGLGWTVVMWSDPNGDGDPADGAPLSDHDSDSLIDTDTIAAGACVSVVARVSIPLATVLGVRDVVTVTATSSQGYGTDSAIDGITALARLAFDPDRSYDALPGEVVFSPHSIVNGGALAETYNLSATTVWSSNVRFWSDPDCDGRSDDGIEITSIGPVAPFGGKICVVVESRIPDSLSAGTTETVTSTAVSQAVPAVSDTAIDTIRAVTIRTYANPLLSLPSATFYRCGTVYAGSGGLAPGDIYRFVWDDANLGDGAERTSPGFSVDDEGHVDDRYTIGATTAIGIWTVKLQIKAGSSWNDVSPFGSFDFTVLDEIDNAGDISALVPDKVNYAVTGDNVRIRGEVYNTSAVTFYRDTTLDYVVFLDANSDGRPTAGETWIRADGTSAVWVLGDKTHQRTMVTVYPFQRLFDTWQVTNVQFTTAAIWSVHMAWTTACNTLVAEDVRTFSVGCAIRPVADAGADVAVCAGSSTVIGTAAEPNRSYSWSPPLGLSNAGIAQPVATPAATTSYTVTVTDTQTSCDASAAMTVTVRTPPAPNVTPDAPRICGGGSITLDAGAGFVAYRWSTGDTTRTITVTPAVDTVYSVTVTDAAGCQGTTAETVIVDAVVAITPPSPETCAGVAVTLTAPAGYASYLWSTGETTRSISVAPASTQSYSVTVTDINGCDASAISTVTVHPLPTPSIVPSNVEICLGAEITLDAGAGFTSYAWLSGETTRTITVSPDLTTVYTVVATNAFGCSASTSATVVVRTMPIYPTVSVSVCPGGSRVLDAGPGYTSYLWSTGARTQTITVSPATSSSYSVTLGDSFGCLGTRIYDVVVGAPPVADAGPDISTCAGLPVVLGTPAVAGLQYLWTPSAGLSDPTRAQPVLLAGASGTWTVQVIDVNGGGCVTTDTVTVTVTPAGPPDPMDNLLRETKSGATANDVHHWWTARAGLHRFDLSWSGDKTFSAPQPLVTLLGEGTADMIEAGAVAATPTLRFYRIVGSDCPFGFAVRSETP